MNSKESQFLIDFISNKYLNSGERKRAIELAFKELSENSISMTEKRELRAYLIGKDKKPVADQKTIYTQQQEELNQNVSSVLDLNKLSRKGEGLPDYKDPNLTSGFLLAYNQDPILKYTCHEIDEFKIIEDICSRCEITKYDLKAHQKLISDTFNNLQKKINIPLNVKGLISAYINGTGLWSSRITINWNCSDLQNWSLNNPGLVPNPGANLIHKYQYDSFKFKPFTSDLNGQRIRNFSELTIFFKYLFHIRNDNSLKTMLEYINEKKGWTDQLEFSFHEEDFWENMEVFTHVEQILNTYKKLMNLILKCVIEDKLEKPKVQFSFKEEGQTKIFGIHHLNSKYGHTLNDTLSRMGETYNYIISTYINGICDFYLKADFGNRNFAEINLWNDKVMRSKTLPDFEGVQYILSFKK